MSTTFLATLYKFFSIAGIAHSSSGCPQAGTVLSESCIQVNAEDISGAYHQTYAKSQEIANGSCGSYIINHQVEDGVCGHPPHGWAVSYEPQYFTVPNLYWSHPQNPLNGQLAHPEQNYLKSYGITYYTSYPETYSTGWQLSNDTIVATIEGVDGWRLYVIWEGNEQWRSTEDDLTP